MKDTGKSGAGFMWALLFIGALFIALKLDGQVSWSWWVVLLPLSPWLFGLIVLLLVLAIGYADMWKDRRHSR